MEICTLLGPLRVTCQLYWVVSVDKPSLSLVCMCFFFSVQNKPAALQDPEQSPERPAALWAERTTSVLLREVILNSFHLYQSHSSCSCVEQLSEVQPVFTKDTSTR